MTPAVRHPAKAVALYLRSRDASIESHNDAVEIQLRAERRLGQLTHDMPKAKGGGEPGVGRRGANNAVAKPDRIPTLADQGIDKRDAAKWQALAALDGGESTQICVLLWSPRLCRHVASRGGGGNRSPRRG